MHKVAIETPELGADTCQLTVNCASADEAAPAHTLLLLPDRRISRSAGPPKGKPGLGWAGLGWAGLGCAGLGLSR